MTTTGGNRRQQAAPIIGPVVAFAAFAVGGLHALVFSIGHAGSTPTFDQIVLGVDWIGMGLFAILVAIPAGVLSIALARLERLREISAPLAVAAVAAAALFALWLAYQSAPGMVTTPA